MDKLNVMNTFVHVAELHSYTAAAAKLNKTKALMSTHIRQLEEALDVRLISRSTRGFTLTDAGKLYYQKARQILDAIHQLEVNLHDGEQQMAGRLRISVPNTFGEEVMLPFVSEFLERYPQVNVELVLTDQYVDLIGQGFDLSVRIGHLKDSTMIAKELGYSSSLLVASPELVNAMNIQQPSDLIDLPMIFDTNLKGDRQRWIASHEGQQSLLDMKASVYVNSARASAELASRCVGVALCPLFAVKAYLETGRLVVLLPEYDFGQVPINAIYPSRNQLPSRARCFIDEFSEFYQTFNYTSRMNE